MRRQKRSVSPSRASHRPVCLSLARGRPWRYLHGPAQRQFPVICRLCTCPATYAVNPARGFPSATLGDGGARSLPLASSGMVPEQPTETRPWPPSQRSPRRPTATSKAAHHAQRHRPDRARSRTPARSRTTSPTTVVVSRKNGFELGAGWNRISKNTGEEYISVSLSAPEFGTIYGNVAPAPGDDKTKKVIIWNPAELRRAEPASLPRGRLIS
jgi:uncharacterized protein (DUF736 family)